MKLPSNDTDRMNRLRANAYAQAEADRRQAIDDFWRGADAVLATAATTTLRAAQRLAHRLQRRHAAMRGAGLEATPCR